MCFLNPARQQEAVAIVTKLTDQLQGVTVEVKSLICIFPLEIVFFFLFFFLFLKPVFASCL